MIKIKKEAVLVSPIDVKPTSKKFEVIGTFNPGAARLSNGDIVLYVRVAERLIKIEDYKQKVKEVIDKIKIENKMDGTDMNEIIEMECNMAVDTYKERLKKELGL